jgi:hypothetical protein
MSNGEIAPVVGVNREVLDHLEAAVIEAIHRCQESPAPAMNQTSAQLEDELIQLRMERVRFETRWELWGASGRPEAPHDTKLLRPHSLAQGAGGD